MPTPFDWRTVAAGGITLNSVAYTQQVPARAAAIQKDPSGRIYRFSVAPGDIVTAIDGASPVVERCELQCTPKMSFNTDYWFSYYMMIEDPGTTDAGSAGWILMGQIHQTEDVSDAGASPLFAREISLARNIEYIRRTSTVDPLLVSPAATVIATITPRWGHWYRVVENHRIDPTGGTGYHRVYHDNVLVADTGTINTGYVDSLGPYLKLGIYRASDASHTLVAHFANIEFSASTLTARNTAPLLVA